MSKRVEEGANSTCKGGGEVKRPNSTYGQPEFFRLLSSLKASKELAISDLRNLGENLRLSYNKKIFHYQVLNMLEGLCIMQVSQS